MPETKPRQRSLRSDAGIKRVLQGKVVINLTLQPDHIAWARSRAAELGYRSISEYIDRLIAQDQIARNVG